MASGHFFDLQLNAGATGNGNALPIDQGGGAVLVVTGTFAATITPEISIDGVTWAGVEVQNLAAGTKATTITAAGIYIVAAPGTTVVRARISAYISGSITISGRQIHLSVVLPAAGAGGGGTEYADKAAFTEGTSGGVKPAGAVFNETITADPGEDQITPLRITAKKGLHVNLRNASGTEIGTVANPVQVTGGGGGTEYADKAAFTEGTSGGVKPAGAVFNDTIVADPLEDQITPLRITAKKGVHVNLRNSAGTEIGTVANPVQVTGGGGGVEYADKAAFTEGTSGGVKPAGAVFNDTITADPAEDQITPLRITAKKGVHVNLRNASGTEVGTAAAPVRIDPTGTTTQPISAASLPLPSGAATEATLGNKANEGVPITGQTLEAGGSSVLGWLSSLRKAITDRLPAALSAGGNLKVTIAEAGTATPVSQSGTPWGVNPTGETAGVGVGAAADTSASNSVIGRLKALIALLPAALVGGRLDVNLGAAPAAITDGGSGKTLKRAVVSLAATGDVIAAVATKRLKVYAYALQSRTAGATCQFRDGAAGVLLGLRWALDVREGAEGAAVNPPAFLFGTVAGNALQAVIAGGTFDIEVSYWDDDTT